MKYLHIKKLEDYNPGYQDRTLIWCKVYFKMINADHDFEMLCEIDKWRFVAFVMLELQSKSPVPLDEDYLTRKGFEFKKRRLSETISSLSQSIEIINVTEEFETRYDSVTQSREEKSRVEDSRVDISYPVFEESVLVLWNEFCDKYPVLSKVKEITGKRRDKLKKRFEVVSFKDFSKILDCISQQQFLLGKNERNWRVSFDWLIENDTNYIKILEKKYANQETEADAARLKEKYKL